MREIKFRAWGKQTRVMTYNINGTCDWELCPGAVGVSENEAMVLMQYTGLKDKNGVEIYEGDLINIFYKSKAEDWFFDGIYRVSIRPTGVSFQFVKLLWESGGYNQLPYESADLKDYGFVSSDYKNQNGDFRLCVADSDKWHYSNYFEVIGNVYQNIELLEKHDAQN